MKEITKKIILCFFTEFYQRYPTNLKDLLEPVALRGQRAKIGQVSFALIKMHKSK